MLDLEQTGVQNPISEKSLLSLADSTLKLLLKPTQKTKQPTTMRQGYNLNNTHQNKAPLRTSALLPLWHRRHSRGHTGERRDDAPGIHWVEAKDAAKRFTKDRAAPCNKEWANVNGAVVQESLL